MELNPYQAPIASTVVSDQRTPQFQNIRRLKTVLRVLIFGEFLLGISSMVVYFLTQAALPEPLRAYVEAESGAAPTGRDLLLAASGLFFLFLFLGTSLALFFFWRPARLLYLITTIVGSLLTPLYGPYVTAGWEAPLEDAALVAAGAILALAYFSPLKVLFEKRQSEKATSLAGG